MSQMHGRATKVLMRLDLEDGVDHHAKLGRQRRLEGKADARTRTGDPFITREFPV